MAIGVKGGEKLAKALAQLGSKLSKGYVKVGFLPDALYPDGTSVAQVAFWNEFGAQAEIPEHTATIYRSLDKNGDFLSGGRFVKAAKSNYATQHTVGAHSITIPPRPFFRSMIAKESPQWGKTAAALMKAKNYDATQVLESMGQEIKDQLVTSINEWTTPGNAPSTIAAKKFDKPLIDTGHMRDSVGWEVVE